MFSFKARTNLDKAFEISILLKAADGALELIGGLLLLFVSPEKITRLAQYLTQHELSEDKKDFIASHILHASEHLTSGAVLFGAVYLLSHGLSKIILVVEILRNRLWAYIGLIVLTTAFIIYQIYRIALSFSWGLTLLTVFDFIVVYLTWREYGKRKSTSRH